MFFQWVHLHGKLAQKEACLSDLNFHWFIEVIVFYDIKQAYDLG